MFKKLIATSGLAVLLLASSTLPVLAQSSTAGAGTPSPVVSPKKGPIVDVACIQAAVDTRDNAIIAGVDAYHDAVKAALQARRDALKAAWAQSGSDRRMALKAAWAAFRASNQSAGKTLRSAKRAAWNQFVTDRKTCGKGASTEDKTTSATDM